MVVWDQLNAHVYAEMRAFIDDHDWLTVFQLPSYTPESTPPKASGPTSRATWPTWLSGVEPTTSPPSNTTSSVCGTGSDLLDAIIAQTELILEPEPPQLTRSQHFTVCSCPAAKSPYGGGANRIRLHPMVEVRAGIRHPTH
ncbi:hypothetical protein GCM10009555_042390 [Acrocarpospora macrocephala]|uniref:hypothetical protein n=1 Tax=Acrocarpospora macrocephala TaxID=150177 RepID=UPI001C3FD2B4|nr:hypothetical protein [Acrocarpospora macrocephala]